MVLVGTNLNASDNSGAKLVLCIRILGNNKSNKTNVGEKLAIVVKKATPQKKATVHSVHRSVLIRQKRKTTRKNGTYIWFFKNSVVLLKKDHLPLSNRVKGSVLQEIRYMNYPKIVLLSWNIM